MKSSNEEIKNGQQLSIVILSVVSRNDCSKRVSNAKKTACADNFFWVIFLWLLDITIINRLAGCLLASIQREESRLIIAVSPWSDLFELNRNKR